MRTTELDQPVLIQMLETVIEADMVQTIMSIPHLTLAERRIALGRALRKGVVQQLAKELVREEVNVQALEGKDISDALAEALLSSCELSLVA